MQTRGEVKKSENFADIISGSSLSGTFLAPPTARNRKTIPNVDIRSGAVMIDEGLSCEAVVVVRGEFAFRRLHSLTHSLSLSLRPPSSFRFAAVRQPTVQRPSSTFGRVKKTPQNPTSPFSAAAGLCSGLDPIHSEQQHFLPRRSG